MAIQVQYVGLAPTDIQLNVSEEDMAQVYDIVANYFISVLPHVELDKYVQYMPEKAAVADFAKKYGVAVDHPPSVVNFYRALLGFPDESGSTHPRPKLAVVQ